MNMYSKMRSINATKSSTMDLSSSLSHLSSPKTPKSIIDPNSTPLSTIPTTPTPKTPSTIEINNNMIKPNTTHDSSPTNKQGDDVFVQKFGGLTRNYSVSSSASAQRYRGVVPASAAAAASITPEQKQNEALQAAVVRAFSLRRSASVSEGYSRIHDQSDPFSSSPTHDLNNNKSKKKNNKRPGKIFKACRNFFGL